jgi:hypothetical protein
MGPKREIMVRGILSPMQNFARWNLEPPEKGPKIRDGRSGFLRPLLIFVRPKSLGKFMARESNMVVVQSRAPVLSLQIKVGFVS